MVETSLKTITTKKFHHSIVIFLLSKNYQR